MKLTTRPDRRPGRTGRPIDPRAKLAAAVLRLDEAERAAQQAVEAEAGAWRPDPGPQTAAAESLADVIGYGGAAGGGKTDLILGLATTEHHKSIVFRREYPQLKDIIRRAKELTEDSRLGFNGNDNLMSLPDGQTIEFGAMQNPDDWMKYKGRPHDLKAYDEATEFLESQVRSSMGWLRTTRDGQRCRVLLTFNPPTSVEGQWVIRFFAPWLDDKHPNPAKPGELRWYAMVEGEEVERPDGTPFSHEGEHEGETIVPTSRTFFPARLADNPRLMRTGYGRTLNALPEPLRSQLLYGDFKAGIGDDPWQVIPSSWVDAAQARYVALEAAGYDPGPMTAMGMDVARGGKDKTDLARRHGRWFAPLLEYPGRETPNGASAAALAVAAVTDDAYINVDVIGWGSSAYERLAEAPPAGHGLEAWPINFACKSEHVDRSGKYRMVNLRAEAYWRLREALDPEWGDEIALPPDPELKSELCAGKYEITTIGIKIELKEKIEERIGHSPNKGDAVALAMLPNGTAQRGGVGGPILPLAPTPEMDLPEPPMPTFGGGFVIPGAL
jgi:hypothetical protein